MSTDTTLSPKPGQEGQEPPQTPQGHQAQGDQPQVRDLSNLPPAVRQQIEAGEQAWREAYEAPGETDEQRAERERVEAVQAEAERVAAQGAMPPSKPPPVPREDRPPAQTAEPPPAWETERRRLEDTIGGLRGSLSQLQEHVRLLSSQQRQPAPKEEPDPELAIQRLLTPQEIEEYGPDAIGVMQRAAQELYEPVVHQLMQRIDGMERQLQGVGQHVQQTVQGTIQGTLTSKVGGDWQQQNADPGFVEWLQQEDPVSGIQRQAALLQAERSGNAERVALIFNLFRQENPGRYQPRSDAPTGGAPQPQAALGGDQGGTGRTASGKVPLASLVAPGSGRGRSAAPSPGAGAQQEPEFISEREVKDHYRARREGRVTPEQRAEFDRRLQAALIAGRVETPAHQLS